MALKSCDIYKARTFMEAARPHLSPSLQQQLQVIDETLADEQFALERSIDTLSRVLIAANQRGCECAILAAYYVGGSGKKCAHCEILSVVRENGDLSWR